MITRKLTEPDITMTTLYVLFPVGDLDTADLKEETFSKFLKKKYKRCKIFVNNKLLGVLKLKGTFS